jgi:hypothetical protein
MKDAAALKQEVSLFSAMPLAKSLKAYWHCAHNPDSEFWSRFDQRADKFSDFARRLCRGIHLGSDEHINDCYVNSCRYVEHFLAISVTDRIVSRFWIGNQVVF